MQKIKITLCIIICFFTLTVPVFAKNGGDINHEQEEAELTAEELNEILEAGASVEDEPIINSRNAVVYDRTSRESTIWKTGECKM